MDYCGDLTFVNYGFAEHTCNRATRRLFDGYYGIQFLYAGPMDARTGDHEVEYTDAPAVFITFPGVPFDYGSPPGTFRAQAHVCFKGDRVRRYCESGLLALPETQLFRRVRDPENFFRTMRSLYFQLKIPGSVAHVRAVLLLEELLLRIHEQPAVPEKLYTYYLNDLLALRDRLVENPLNEWDFQREARQMSLSYVHFRRIFRQVTGWAPGAFLLECRLRHAEKMLMSTHDRVAEIAAVCRFGDAYHFSRIFKKHTSHSPAEFRRLFGNK